MDSRIKVTARGRRDVYAKPDRAPFWLEHIGALITIGLVVVVGALIGLSITEWGRATLVWLGVAGSLVLTVVLARDPWRSWRAGQPKKVWIGEAISALGWSGMTVSLGVGLPYIFWRGPDGLSEWAFAIPGVGAVLFTAISFLGIKLQLDIPLPALDRTPRTAHVTFNAEDSEGAQDISVHYQGADGKRHHAELADVIDDSWVERFAPGTKWQVYAFRSPKLANILVFLTEAHDEVWRSGYKLDGVRLGTESGPVTPGPGSPFLREDAKWQFSE